MTVSATLRTVGARQEQLASRGQLVRAGVAGGTLHRALVRGEVVRVRRRVYAAAALPPWPRFAVTDEGVHPDFLAHVRAVLLGLGPRAAACGLTAACLRGWGVLLEPLRTVDVALPNGRRRGRSAGVRTTQRRRLCAEHWTVRPGHASLRVTTAVQTVLDCCRQLPHLQAVVVVDSALRSGQVTLEELQRAARALPGTRHGSRVRRALRACDPESGSVLESVLRVHLCEAGLDGFATQVVLRDARGRRILRADFVFTTARLVVETDGARWHADPARDRRTDNRLAAAGWRVLRFTWDEVVHDPAAVLAGVRAALAAHDGQRLRFVA